MRHGQIISLPLIPVLSLTDTDKACALFRQSAYLPCVRLQSKIRRMPQFGRITGHESLNDYQYPHHVSAAGRALVLV